MQATAGMKVNGRVRQLEVTGDDAATASLGKRIAVFAYGATVYTMFLGVFVYAVGFIGNFLVPTTLDGPRHGSLVTALLVNLGLLTAFALQHSVMARPAFKRWWTRFVPQPMERSTYVLATNLAMLLMFWQWRPMGGVIWNIQHPFGAAVMYGLFAFGFGLVLVSTLLINHFDLFGLRQVFLYLQGKPYRCLKFVTPGPYKMVRHPLYVGWFFAFWATPTMTAAHLVFAIMTTAYILVAIQLEERDLVAHFGDTYTAYRRRVPMLVPRFFRRAAAGEAMPVMEAGPAEVSLVGGSIAGRSELPRGGSKSRVATPTDSWIPEPTAVSSNRQQELPRVKMKYTSPMMGA